MLSYDFGTKHIDLIETNLHDLILCRNCMRFYKDAGDTNMRQAPPFLRPNSVLRPLAV